MKLFIMLTLPWLLSVQSMAQQSVSDSRAIINLQKNDTAEIIALAYLGYQQPQNDSAVKYAQLGLALAKKLNYRKGEAYCLLVLSSSSGDDFSKSIQFALNALDIFENIKDYTGIASAHLRLQGGFWSTGDYTNSLIHAFAGEKIAEAHNVKGLIFFPDQRLAPLFLAEIGQIYLLRNQLDSAKIYSQKTIAQNELFNGAKWNFPVYLLAYVQTMQGDYKDALENFYYALTLAKNNRIYQDTLQIFSGMSTLFKRMGKLDSTIHYAQMVTQSLNPQLEIKNLLEAFQNLAEAYRLKGIKDSVIKYIELNYALKDSIFSRDKDRAVQSITFSAQLKQQGIIAAQYKYKSQVQFYAMALGLLAVVLITGILWRHNIHRQKAYSLLEKQKEETDFQKLKAEQAFDELQSTQKQLIQSEKMASLGELTAGIAHEIQNPLNFVNNFSEVNKELIGEMKEEIEKGNYDEVKIIAKDIEDNEEKINHHGKRADAIVKGMLQHSRSTAGKKELTDVNALADEYLRLSYHGLRARDKSFNATMETDLDPSLPKLQVNAQDIGRVMLNLITNAFYAVSEKKKLELPGYVPTVWVQTKKEHGKVEIRIKDNGIGIPTKVLDKIFQPFFTTKPAGQGTGLGLSLSYDIVTKGHGGEMHVETKEGEGSVFTIILSE